jgi:hypothetical protein
MFLVDEATAEAIRRAYEGARALVDVVRHRL